MATSYNSMDELKRKKELLKKEVEDLQELLTFQNKKESLSALTNGFTDKFLQEVPDADAEDGTKLQIKSDEIISTIKEGIKEKISAPSTDAVPLISPISKTDVVESALSLGSTALIANIAEKNMRKSSWQKKILGLAILYFAPIVFKFIREKLEDYQQHKSVSSMEQLI